MAASVMPAAWAMSRTLARAVPFSEKSWSAASRICLRVSGPRRSLRERPVVGGAGAFLAVTKGRNLASMRFSVGGASGRCQFKLARRQEVERNRETEWRLAICRVRAGRQQVTMAGILVSGGDMPDMPVRVGHRASFTKTVTDEDVAGFARVTGDDQRLHLDES